MLLLNSANAIGRRARDEESVDSPLKVGTNAGVELSPCDGQAVQLGWGEMAFKQLLDRRSTMGEDRPGDDMDFRQGYSIDSTAPYRLWSWGSTASATMLR